MKIAEKYFPLITLGFFGFLYFHFAKNMLLIMSDGWYVGQINLYGDLVFHLTLINRFIATNSLLIDNPIFSGTIVNYPIFPDWITAKIVQFSNINFAVFSTTFLVGVLGIYVARIFIRNFIRNEKVVFLSLILFFINGGLGFYYFFRDFSLSHEPLTKFLFSMPEQYTDIKEKGYWWINTYLAYFIPQRTFLFAFPITLIVLILLYKGTKNNRIIFFVLAGMLAGTLPLVQAQSLFLIFLLSLMYFPILCLKVKDKKTIIINWLSFALITAVLSVPLFKAISSAQNPLSFIKYAPGWTSQENLAWFWFKNLGLFGPILIISLIWLYKKNQKLFLSYLPFITIFILSNIFIFQPWNFDNSKLLVYWFFVSCIVVAYFLYDQFLQKTLFKKIIGITLVFFMIFAGGLDIFRTFTPVTNYKIFSNQDLQIASNVKNMSAKDSIFLTASNHNHPIAALSGRSVFSGFHGWLWSHGIDIAKRENDARLIYLGGQEAETLIRNYRINYVTISPLEKAEFSINESYFQKYPSFTPAEGWQIYDVSNLWSDFNRKN